MGNRCKDILGQRFGRLVVLERAENYVKPSKTSQTAQWLCQCDCGALIIAREDQLRRGSVQSCGCLHREVAAQQGKKRKKYNKYDLTHDYGIGYTSNTNEPFLFDLEDYDKIKDFCWSITKNGYILAPRRNEKGNIFLHRLILEPKEDEFVDHIYHYKFDNRKSQLRIVNKSQNGMNMSLPSTNTSGVKGVYFNKQNQEWFAAIKVNQKNIYLGSYKNFDDAKNARMEAEKEYFGEYAFKEKELELGI